MQDRQLYAQILGVTSPWTVDAVDLDKKAGELRVFVTSKVKTLECPKCGVACRRYDHRKRRWRHLDTCQYQTILIADVPRVDCPEHGATQIEVPWAEPGSRFTALFEALVIDWCRETSIQAVARQMSMSWDEVAGVTERAVRRGLARRPAIDSMGIGVDETSFAKRHEYVTVVTDLDDKNVVHVADCRGRAALDAFYDDLDDEQRARISIVAMDMHQPYISSTEAHVPDAAIVFDKFHVAKLLGDSVDKVRREEHRALLKDGDDRLKGSKYFWLQNPSNISGSFMERFGALRDSALKTARAWALKETAMGLWRYISPAWIRKGWRKWIGWALRSRLEPIRKAARTIRRHLEGIVNATTLGVTNAMSESINARIQRVKKLACGFRNRERFRMAIYFHLGGLDLYPKGVGATHTES